MDAEDFSLVVFPNIKKAASGNPNQWPGSLANLTVSPSHPSELGGDGVDWGTD